MYIFQSHTLSLSYTHAQHTLPRISTNTLIYVCLLYVLSNSTLFHFASKNILWKPPKKHPPINFDVFWTDSAYLKRQNRKWCNPFSCTTPQRRLTALCTTAKKHHVWNNKAKAEKKKVFSTFQIERRRMCDILPSHRQRDPITVRRGKHDVT